MTQYDKIQIKQIISKLEEQMATASGKSFDRMERARRDLKSWDGTGALPHEKMLRELNILDEKLLIEKESLLVEVSQSKSREHSYAPSETDHDRVARRIKEYIRGGEEGNHMDDLPMLNEALEGVQILIGEISTNPSMQGLHDNATRAKHDIERLRKSARDRLGVMATAEGQEKYKELYMATRALIERNSPPPTILQSDGTEVSLLSYWKNVRLIFVNWLKRKVTDYVKDADTVARSYPQLARDKLFDALNILEDDVLAREDAISLETDKIHVLNEIEKIDQIIKSYEKAQLFVAKGQNINLHIAERLEHLLVARELFPNYPNIEIYIDEAEKESLLEKDIIRAEGKIIELIDDLKEYLPDNKLDETLVHVKQIDVLLEKLREEFEEIQKIIHQSNTVQNLRKRDEILENLKSVRSIFGISAFKQIEVSLKDTFIRQSKKIGNFAHPRALLVLDIDESLVYSSDNPLDPNAHFELAGYNVVKRPFIDEFLEKIIQSYDIAIWTGATEEYTKYMIPKIIPNPMQLKFVWSRNHCSLKFDYDKNDYYWLKDIKKITKLGYQKERILFIEDDPRSLQRNYGNLVQVISFSGSSHDQELKLLENFLELIVETEDLRQIDKRNWRDITLKHFHQQAK